MKKQKKIALIFGITGQDGADKIELEEAYVESLDGASFVDNTFFKLGRAFWNVAALNPQHAHADEIACRVCTYVRVLYTILLFLQRSRFGLEMRAVTQNRAIAKTMGINSSRVDYLTFGLGSGIAGLAGAVLSQVLKTNPDMGTDLIIPSFMVIVVGGVGSLWGALVGAGLVGMATKLVEPLFPNNTLLATAIILVAVIGFIQFRPRGLFAQKGRSAEL